MIIYLVDRALVAGLVTGGVVDDIVDELIEHGWVDPLLALDDFPLVLHDLGCQLQLVIELIVPRIIAAEVEADWIFWHPAMA